MTPPVVLVTGGTGLVGGAIVEAMRDLTVVSLTRHGGAGWQSDVPRSGRSAAALLPSQHGHVVSAAAEGDAHVLGDVTRPQFGLSDARWGELAEAVDIVVHSAGVSDFTTPRRATNALNIGGTRHVLDFARRADAVLYHVSSGYVRAQGTSLGGRWGAQVYIESKSEAERLVEASGLDASIVRPSIVFGDAQTGATPSFQGLHRLVGMMLENRMPLLPFEPATRVDFLPRDVIGKVTARIVREGGRGQFWLTAGQDAMSFGRIVELMLEYGGGRGMALDPPRFVSRDMIERLIKPAGGEAVARRLDILLALTSHFIEQPLPSSLRDDERCDIEAAFRRGVEYWWERHLGEPMIEVGA
jgi:nucleoside-diphosphate-sugar epimerase